MIGPLVTKFKLLRESMNPKYTSLENAIEIQKAGMALEIGKIEKMLNTHKAEISTKIEWNNDMTNSKINLMINENKKL